LSCPFPAHEHKENDGRWSCPQCTYLNSQRINGQRSLQCAMCGHRKTQSVENNKRCGAMWHFSLIKQILCDGGDVKSEEVSKLELLSARNNFEHRWNLQKCPSCSTVHYKYKKHTERIRNAQGFRQFRTKCSCCPTSFCWNCAKPWTRGHQCRRDVNEEVAQILSTCERKAVGCVSRVPSVRACPNPQCGQLITHLSACKHMICASCKLAFCFVCLKPRLVSGRWQCGTYATRCPVAPRQKLRESRAGIKLSKSFQIF